jgi:hypothetical protein
LRETTYMNLLLSMSSIKKNRDGKQWTQRIQQKGIHPPKVSLNEFKVKWV